MTDLGELYPFESRYLDIEGQRLHYVDEGRGPAIVFVHGNPTWSFYFREPIKGLRGTHRAIAIDHMGCGLSDKPQDYPYTLSTHIRNLERLIDHLRLDDVVLAVHDWGGPIGLGWAVRNAERVRGLVVFNTAAFLEGRMPFSIRMSRWPVIGELGVRGLNLFARAALRTASARRERMTRQVRRGYLAPYDSYANRVAILRFVRDIPFHPGVPSYAVMREIESSLPNLSDKPMVLFWGARDFVFNDAYLDVWRRRFPGAQVHRFADAGHYVVEDAYERILPLMSSFLRATAAGTPGMANRFQMT